MMKKNFLLVCDLLNIIWSDEKLWVEIQHPRKQNE